MNEQEIQATHSFESQLIIDCSQTQMSVENCDRVADALRRPLDWDYLLETARRSCVLPLISRNLTQKFDVFLPPEIKQSLDTYFQKHTRENMFMTAKLLEIIRLFNSNNIPILPFKGPLLAMQFYESIALRSFGDLDVLVQIKHIETAVKLLEQLDYEPLNKVNWLDKHDLHINHKEVRFVQKETRVALDLHWKLSGSYFGLPLEMDRLWVDLETENFGGMRVNNLSFNDLLIYLCLHGGRHGWERLSWICDINQMVSAKENIEWDQITKEAKRLGCEKALGLGLYLINDFFGNAAPILKNQNDKNCKLFAELTQKIRERLFNHEPNLVEINNRAWFLEQQLFHLKLKERLWDKFKLHLYYNKYYLEQIFSPNKADEDLLPLPPWLSPLYYIIRPARLSYRYIINFKKSKYSKD